MFTPLLLPFLPLLTLAVPLPQWGANLPSFPGLGISTPRPTTLRPGTPLPIVSSLLNITGVVTVTLPKLPVLGNLLAASSTKPGTTAGALSGLLGRDEGPAEAGWVEVALETCNQAGGCESAIVVGGTNDAVLAYASTAEADTLNDGTEFVLARVGA